MDKIKATWMINLDSKNNYKKSSENWPKISQKVNQKHPLKIVRKMSHKTLKKGVL